MDRKLLKKLFRQSYDFDDAVKGTRDVQTLTNETVQKAKSTYMHNYTIEEIEDAFMEALMYVMERCKRDPEFEKTVSISSVTFKMREIAKRTKFKENGYNARGKVPRDGRNFHIQNEYDDEGRNKIEDVPNDYDWREH